MEIRLLGLVEASHDGHVLPLGGAKPRALLAILALQANTSVSADRLIAGLWGDHAPATAPKVVQVLVSQLRKQLAGSDAEIVTRGRGYELRVDAQAETIAVQLLPKDATRRIDEPDHGNCQF